MPDAVLIIPALNEEPVLASTLASIPAGIFRQVIVADNGSTDQTARVAAEAGATVVVEPRRGYGAACLRALSVVPRDATAVVFMQADGSEDPREAARLLAPLYDGRADLVIGSRTHPGVEKGALAPHQRFGNWLATGLVRLLYGFRYSDLGPFRAIRLDSLEKLGMRDRTYGWTIEMQVKAIRGGLRVMETPVSYRVRQAGVNKISGRFTTSLRAGMKILWTLARFAISPR